MKTQLNIEIRQLAENFANGNNHEQAELLNTFSNELRIACKGDKMAFERQVCDISHELDAHGEHFIKELYQFIKLKNESN